jgi:hypothetical protein
VTVTLDAELRASNAANVAATLSCVLRRRKLPEHDYHLNPLRRMHNQPPTANLTLRGRHSGHGHAANPDIPPETINASKAVWNIGLVGGGL